MVTLTKTEKAYYKAAKAISNLSDFRVKLGAVVVRGHRIISSGCNSFSKTDRIQAELDMKKFGVFCEGKVHAECDALLPFIKRGISLNGATLYVYREHKNGTLAMARPCERCMKLIKQCGIRKINYTTDDGYCTEKIDVQ